MKKTIAIFFIFISIHVFAQKQNENALYTICGQPGKGTIVFSPEELAKCKLELVPLSAEDKIISFAFGVSVNGAYTEFSATGNGSASEFFQSLKNMKSGKIVIQKVKITRNKNEIKAPGVVIQIK